MFILIFEWYGALIFAVFYMHINFTNFLSILPWIGQTSKYFLCNNHQDSLSASIMHDNFVIHINVAVCKDINYQEDIIWVILCQILCTLITVVECELQSCLEAFCVYLFLRSIWSDLKIELQNDHAGFHRSDIPLLSVVSGKGYLSFSTKFGLALHIFLQLRKLFPFHMIKKLFELT